MQFSFPHRGLIHSQYGDLRGFANNNYSMHARMCAGHDIVLSAHAHNPSMITKLIVGKDHQHVPALCYSSMQDADVRRHAGVDIPLYIMQLLAGGASAL